MAFFIFQMQNSHAGVALGRCRATLNAKRFVKNLQNFDGSFEQSNRGQNKYVLTSGKYFEGYNSFITIIFKQKK